MPEQRNESSAAQGRLTYAEAVHQIRELLSELGNAPHEKHAGPLCPICGLVTGLRMKLEECERRVP